MALCVLPLQCSGPAPWLAWSNGCQTLTNIDTTLPVGLTDGEERQPEVFTALSWGVEQKTSPSMEKWEAGGKSCSPLTAGFEGHLLGIPLGIFHWLLKEFGLVILEIWDTKGVCGVISSAEKDGERQV